MTRNGRRFSATYGPYVIDPQREALYQRYRSTVHGERSPSLKDFLFGDTTSHAFDTQEIAIWEGETLVAFSWFDVGNTSLQSLIGVYEPSLKQHSLGFYSMLLEIEHGLKTGRRFHYSGYVLPGDPSMDYKLRVGDLEFLDQDQRCWRPWSEVDDYRLPTNRLEEALRLVEEQLTALGIGSDVSPYPWFDAGVYNPALSRCIDQPLLLETRPYMAQPLVVTWDLDEECYHLYRCVRAVAIIPGDEQDLESGHRPDLLVVTERLAVTANPDEVSEELAMALGHPLYLSR
jgi:arginine-tRNA-protein transferase